MMEDKRNCLNCTFVSDDHLFSKHSCHPLYYRSIMLDKNCSITVKKSKSWIANQPIHLALSVGVVRHFYYDMKYFRMKIRL